MADDQSIKVTIALSLDNAQRTETLIEPILERCQSDIRKMTRIVKREMGMTPKQAQAAVMDLLRP